MSKSINKEMPPQVIGGDRIIYGICPKCGGRYVPGSGYAVYPNFYNEPIYRCLDCGFEYIDQATA